MLSKNKIKYIKSLELKKNRKEEKVFVAEGHKSVDELLHCFSCKLIIATSEWLSRHYDLKAQDIIEVSDDELAKASFLKSPQEVLAIFEQPEYKLDSSLPNNNLCLALDEVQDPGNLGTIVRVADWFGIENIFCSLGTADIYNPKTVQATMGAISRVKVHYCDLPAFISSLEGVKVYGTFLDGENLYDSAISENGLIVMGNEGNGISSEIEKMVNSKLLIPNYPVGRTTSESLNVAMATGIICAEFRRRIKR